MTPIVRTLADDLVLQKGAHASPDAGMCALEAVAYVAGERHSDHPVCASPVVSAFLRTWNDAIPDTAHRTALLRPLVLKLVDSVASPAVELRRSRLAIDWLARVQAPAWLDLTPALQPHAAALRGLAPLDSESTCVSAQPALSAAWSAALSAAESAARSAALSAAESAAESAAGSAARSAALSAAGSAALSAAGSAAGSAAWLTARSAAGSAARSAARSALQPTVTLLEISALDLVDRMLAITEDQP